MTLRDFKALVAAIPEEHDDRLAVIGCPDGSIHPLEEGFELGDVADALDCMLAPLATRTPSILFYAINN